MCIAIPVKVIKVNGHDSIVSIGTVEKAVSLIFTPEVKEGDFVIVHAGFAISKVKDSFNFPLAKGNITDPDS